MNGSQRLKNIGKKLTQEYGKLKFNSKVIYDREEEIDNEQVTNQVSEILPGLYLTSFNGLKSVESNNIDHTKTLVINATTNLEVLAYFKITLRIPLLDTIECKIYDHLDSIADLINKYLKIGYNVIVHCKAGISRSPSLVIAYLIKYHGLSLNDALEFLKKKRSVVDPNIGFYNELNRFYESCNESK